ncbi:hypothetical protein [Alloyangia pacifica]|uniref:DUF2946 domain-containing protein n=1 Tax=Alloyangia pacifica TaxID=311180 RepID=A0A1I6RIU7_9RHOB|nr:hypothetical protein [Alloyangia pacifica]SDG51704.1 hypothetical protein SAMN04488245_103120 [Alloyangia pacifica]SFS64632.1 hypothetical protein SAMN04488050_103120 [Alloyangia pacifica]
MSRLRAFRLTLPLVILAVALASVVFAARMAPEEPAEASLRGYLAMGGTLADLCEGDTFHHAHHCPVCNLLPEVPEIAPAALTHRIDHRFQVAALRELGLVPQQAYPRNSPRAPPAQV